MNFKKSVSVFPPVEPPLSSVPWTVKFRSKWRVVPVIVGPEAFVQLPGNEPFVKA